MFSTVSSSLIALATVTPSLVVRGAPAIGVSGAFGMALAALHSSSKTKEDLLSDLENAKKILFETRPTAVNLSWALEQIMQIAKQSETVSEIRNDVIIKSENIVKQDDYFGVFTVYVTENQLDKLKDQNQEKNLFIEIGC